jgi:hypothetical protein
MPVKGPSPSDRVPKVFDKRHVPEAQTHRNIPLRDWACPSYSATDGRSASSLADAGGKDGYTHAKNVSTQCPTAFDRIDKRRTQGPVAVGSRPFTQKHEG